MHRKLLLDIKFKGKSDKMKMESGQGQVHRGPCVSF